MHYESLETLSEDDEKKSHRSSTFRKNKGIQSKKKKISNVTRISKSTKKEINTTIEPNGKAKVNKGEYNNDTHTNTNVRGVPQVSISKLISHNIRDRNTNEATA